MNLKSILSCSLAAIALAGCWSPHSEENMPGRQGMWVGDAIRAASINKAIVRQHVIYPYHFTYNSAELNPLGRRDLAVLADHYRANPGALSVRRSGAAQGLYDERVLAVMNHLKAAGVAMERMTLADVAPDGDGIASERLVKILREPAQLVGYTTDSTGGATTSSTVSSDMATTE